MVLLFFSLFMSATWAMLCTDPANEPRLNDIKAVVEKMNSFECPSWILNQKSLPICPDVQAGEKATLPETFPKAFVFLSNDLSESALVEIIEKNIQDNPGQLPVFSYNNGGNKELITKLTEKFPYIKWNEHLIEIGSNDTYIRDNFTSRINDKGQVEVFITFGRIQEEFGDVLKKCRMELDSRSISHSFEGKGGNFLTIVPGINLTTQITKTQEQSGYNPDNTIIFPTLTIVKHIDEILQPIATKFDRKGCPMVTALIASPDKTKELLLSEAKKDPTRKFFNHELDNSKQSGRTRRVLNSPRNDSMDSGLNLVQNVKQICQEYYALPESEDLKIRHKKTTTIQFRSSRTRASSPGKPYKEKLLDFKPEMSDDEFRTKLAELEDLSIPKIITVSGELSDEQVTIIHQTIHSASDAQTKSRTTPFLHQTKAYSSSKGAKKHCNDLTVGDVFQVLNNGEYLAENNELQENINNLKSELEKRLQKQYPHCKAKVDWIDTPVIKKDGAWALPNAVNSLPTTHSSLALPEPYSDVFKGYLSNEFRERKLSPIWVDTFGMNNIPSQDDAPLEGGNVHCLTNSIPICRPK